MRHSSFNYVRTHRVRHAFTTDDLAFLIGQRSGTAISQYEHGDRAPMLHGALALQVVFGIEPRALFPGHYEHIEDAVMRRARVLHAALEGKTDQRSAAKRELLEAMAARRDNLCEV